VESKKQSDADNKSWHLLNTKFVQTKAELQRERHITRIAKEFMPEEKYVDFYNALPADQPVWIPSSPTGKSQENNWNMRTPLTRLDLEPDD